MRSRQKASKKDDNANPDQMSQTVKQEILGEIHEKIVGNFDTSNVEKFSEIMLGDIVEKKFDAPMVNDNMDIEEKIGFPAIKLTTLKVSYYTRLKLKFIFDNLEIYGILETFKKW